MLAFSGTEWTVIGTLVTAAIGALGLYLREGRKLTGRIKRSDAEVLWQESAALRADCREQLKIANERIQRLEARVDELEAENAMKTLDNYDLRRQVAELKLQLHGEGHDA